MSGALVHKAALEEGVLAGSAFVDDSHLAVTPRSGNLLMITIDPTSCSTLGTWDYVEEKLAEHEAIGIGKSTDT